MGRDQGADQQQLPGGVRVGKDVDRRRRRQPGDPRTVRVTVRLSDEEHAQVVANAATARLAVAAYLARAGCEPPVPPEVIVDGVEVELLRELMAVQRQLRGAAGNLNQLVAARHATGTEPGALPATVEYLTRLSRSIDDLTVDISTRMTARRRRRR